MLRDIHSTNRLKFLFGWCSICADCIRTTACIGAV